MSSYPINSGDAESLLDAVNYAVSGPSGLGQQLKGFSSYTSSRLTGNFRVPYTNPSNNPLTLAKLYVDPIPLGNSYWLDDLTWRHEFAVAQPEPPFALGNNITISGVTPSDYDGTYSRVGVVECSTTYVIARASGPFPNPGVVGTGGTASLWVTSGWGALMSTDANAIVAVDAGNNLVSVTGQIDISPFDYGVYTTNYPAVVPTMSVSVDLNRYKAYNSGTAANPQYFYEFDATLSSQLIYSTSITAATEGVPTSYNIISGSSGAASTGFYPGVYATSSTGTGTNAQLWANITADSTDYTTSLDIVSAEYGGGYQVGDLVTFSGSDLGGITPDNDLVLEVATVSSTGDVTAPESLTIFTPIIDNPSSGLYWYIMEVNVSVSDAEVAVRSMTLNRRSLTAQVIKK